MHLPVPVPLLARVRRQGVTVDVQDALTAAWRALAALHETGPREATDDDVRRAIERLDDTARGERATRSLAADD